MTSLQELLDGEGLAAIVERHRRLPARGGSDDIEALLALLRIELWDQNVALACRLVAQGEPTYFPLTKAMERRQAHLEALLP